MTQFQKGQEIEVCVPRTTPSASSNPTEWRKARIIRLSKTEPGKWIVELWNHDRAVFDAEHIREMNQ